MAWMLLFGFFLYSQSAAFALHYMGAERQEKEGQAPDRMVVLHPRKAGGSTLAKFLMGNLSFLPDASQFKPGQCLTDPPCSVYSYGTPYGCAGWGDSHAHFWRRLNEVRSCPHVELHHFDITGILPFKNLGFKSVAMVREPVSLLESSFNFEFRRETFESEGGKDAYFRTWTMSRSPIQEQIRSFAGCGESRDHMYDVVKDGNPPNLIRANIEKASPGLCNDGGATWGGKVPTTSEATTIALNGALSMAERYIDTILLMEAFTESVALLDKKHGIKIANPCRLDVANKNMEGHPYKFVDLPQEIRVKFPDIFKAETIFYQTMVKRFVNDAILYGVDLSKCAPCAPYLAR